MERREKQKRQKLGTTFELKPEASIFGAQFIHSEFQRNFLHLQDFLGPPDSADTHVMANPDRPWHFPGLASKLGLVKKLAGGFEVRSIKINHDRSVLDLHAAFCLPASYHRVFDISNWHLNSRYHIYAITLERMAYTACSTAAIRWSACPLLIYCAERIPAPSRTLRPAVVTQRLSHRAAATF